LGAEGREFESLRPDHFKIKRRPISLPLAQAAAPSDTHSFNLTPQKLRRIRAVPRVGRTTKHPAPNGARLEEQSLHPTTIRHKSLRYTNHSAGLKDRARREDAKGKIFNDGHSLNAQFFEPICGYRKSRRVFSYPCFRWDSRFRHSDGLGGPPPVGEQSYGLLCTLLSHVRNSMFVGVYLFFCLSGFLITGILIKTINIPHFFKTFYGRRTLRIFPLYYACLFLLIALTKPLHFVWSGTQYYSLLYIGNLALWHRGPFYIGHFNINHFWSLQVEEQFYLVWPFVIYRIRKVETLIRVCLIGCLVVLGIRTFITIMLDLHVFKNQYLTGSPTFSCADHLLFGCCLALLMRTHWRDKVLRFAPRVLLTSVLILVAFAIPNRGLEPTEHSPIMGFLIQTVGLTLVGIASTALIAMTLRARSKAQRVFENRTLRFLGKYSYGIYIFHYSMIGFFEIPLRAFFNAHLPSKGLSLLLEAFVVGGSSVVLAVLSYHLFEVHFLRLKRYFSYDRATPDAPASQSPAPS
jgi:peptidoglycan/LPS O-acetylase OafA/YrhL